MMVRTQIALDTEAHRRAKARAAELGVSLAEYIRRTVDKDLGSTRAGGADPSAIIGLFRSGGSDIARDKDEAIADAIAAKMERGRRPR